ncbi:MAG TPA: hypothetical protein DD391_06165 [Clostridiales bacterium]|nr:hypothetical protein [Clostridiales bacterium]HBL82170.1 hypothetical protein [Clostridiales bacterium]
MIFYVIGNGFDLHYGLPTSYCHFKNYLIENGKRDIVDKIDNLFWERGDFNPEDIEKWSDFENMLTVFNNLFADDLCDEAFDNAETDDDRADFWDSPSWNVSYYNEYIKILKQQFASWINEMNTEIIPDKYFTPQSNDVILTFNYTTTIEDNFDTSDINIIHIHGTKNQEIILGHNSEPDPDLFNIIEDEESDYRDITTRKAVNSVITEAAESYYKDNANILKNYSNLFKNISKFDKVVILGLSCGEQDELYVQEIIKHSKVIDFYWYDKTTMENFDNIVNNSNVKVNYFYW